MNNFDIEKVKFDAKGLVPCIVQDYMTKRVLCLAYMNKESLTLTLEKRLTCFYSRSREELWLKGDTSGNYQHIIKIESDCDNDTLLVQVTKDGPACHRGKDSCFDDSMSMDYIINNEPELIDIYNVNRERTGEVLPRDTRLKKGQYMLYVLAVLEDEYGKILATKRSLNKKWGAGAWEVPGGSAKAGEDSTTAVVREVLEETGLDVSGCKSKLIYSYVNEDTESGDNYFVDIYHFKGCFDKSRIRVKSDEIIDYKFLDSHDIKQLKEEDGFLHYERIVRAMEPFNG